MGDFMPKKGKLCLHLLAKSKDAPYAGFYRSTKRSLLWTEMFLLMLCRKKNPEILNIVGHSFLEDCAVEGVTYPIKGSRSKPIKTFRNALGFDTFTAARWKSAQPISKSSTQTVQPAQPGKVVEVSMNPDRP